MPGQGRLDDEVVPQVAQKIMSLATYIHSMRPRSTILVQAYPPNCRQAMQWKMPGGNPDVSLSIDPRINTTLPISPEVDQINSYLSALFALPQFGGKMRLVDCWRFARAGPDRVYTASYNYVPETRLLVDCVHSSFNGNIPYPTVA
jgi:hypothetical protein